MKKLFLLLAAMAVLAGCANNNSSKKPQAPAEEPAPVEAEAEPAAEPALQAVHHQAQPLMQPVKAEAEAEEPQASAPAETPGEEAAPVKEKTLTVDALCSQFGVYDLLSQYDRCLKDGDKKSARKIESQLSQLKKQVKNDAALPEKLRESFRNYLDDKQEEIGERY